LRAGSKDNISAMLVKLPGAVFGPESNGGVDKRRQQRSGYAMDHIDENPPFTLNSAPIILQNGGNMEASDLMALVKDLVNRSVDEDVELGGDEMEADSDGKDGKEDL
jgi:hypothetical protein